MTQTSSDPGTFVDDRTFINVFCTKQIEGVEQHLYLETIEIRLDGKPYHYPRRQLSTFATNFKLGYMLPPADQLLVAPVFREINFDVTEETVINEKALPITFRTAFDLCDSCYTRLDGKELQMVHHMYLHAFQQAGFYNLVLPFSTEEYRKWLSENPTGLPPFKMGKVYEELTAYTPEPVEA